MRAITSIVAAAGVVLASSFSSHAITNTAIAVSGTNIILSWPSHGYESYLVQYRETLNATDSWSQVVNGYPANTNRTTYTLFGLVPSPALNGGGGGNVSSLMATAAATITGPLVIPADGSDGGVPLSLYPPGFDLSGFLILDPSTGETVNGAGYSVAPVMKASSLDGPLPMDGPVDGPPYNPPTPTTGFFRVFHIPDFLADFTGYTFNGPTFIPVDFSEPDAPADYVETTAVLINGQPTDNAVFMPYVYNGVTNWGVGIYFDRFPNGTATLQLITTVRLSDTLNDQTPYMVYSNTPATITIGNAITFTNWSDLQSGSSYTFKAQSTVQNVDWEIDIYDVNNYFVNYQTGHSSDGNIEWTWDMIDYWGNSRLDDDDPFFYPEITITPSSSANGPRPNASNTPQAMPVVASEYPSVGSWVFSYLKNFYNDGTTLYPTGNANMQQGISEMEGGPIAWNIGTWEYPIKYGRSYTQAERDASWQGTTNSSGLVDLLDRWTVRNFYYFGHGASDSIGCDVNEVDTNGAIVAGTVFKNSHAYLTSQWVHDNVTCNRWRGAMPFHFVFLDGCNTSTGNWPWAWGMANQVEPLSYYQDNGTRPSAFVGWNVEMGGNTSWGTIEGFWSFREFWMASWTSAYFQTLKGALNDARDFSHWVDPSQVNSHLSVWGYSDMTFFKYNHAGDWP